MSQLPTLDDLLRRKATERDETARPHERALSAQRDLAAAHVRYWLLLEEFVARARELGVRSQTWRSPSQRGSIARFAWIEGYPLTGGAVVSAPPLRYCVTERRRVLRPQQQVHEVEELSLFVASADYEATRGGDFEQQTASKAGWPRMDRLDRTAQTLTALERELEASLLGLMD
jgi:hypothetical protein